MKVRDRFWIIDGELPERAMIEKAWKAFAKAS